MGQYVAARLLEDYPRTTVSILARSERTLFLPGLSGNSRIKIYHGFDLKKPEAHRRVLEAADAIIHCAAMISFWRKDASRLLEQNQLGTLNLIKICRDLPEPARRRLVHVSSTAALGYNNDPDRPADEDFSFVWGSGPFGPRQYPYAWSKYQAEREALAAKDLPLVIVNPSSIYGPGDEKIKPLIEKIKAGTLPALMPGSLACADVRDVASGIAAALRYGKPGERYILTSGNYSHAELIGTIAKVFRAKPPQKTLTLGTGLALKNLISILETVSTKPPQMCREIFDMGFVHRRFSIQKAREQLKWSPQYDLEHTFEDIKDYLCAQ